MQVIVFMFNFSRED